MPTLKTLPAAFNPNLLIKNQLREMLDLRNVYKIFERC